MNIDYLRVSVTNRCNLRCVYCNPAGDCFETEVNEILSSDEIRYIVGLLVRCGVRKVRLTGGEPLIRKDIVKLTGKLAEIPGLEELSLTTNGVLLESLATELQTAGLQRVNISVDSVDKDCYRRITGFDLLSKVMAGIHMAIETGLSPVKINSVIVKDFNNSEEQIRELAGLSLDLPVAVRFIEYYPINKYTESVDDYIPNSEVKAVVEQRYGPLCGIVPEQGHGPALYFKIKNSTGTIGFISGRSSVFCHSCNRLRLTCDGRIMPCLYSSVTYDLKDHIRNRDDGRICDLFEKIMYDKPNYTKLNWPGKKLSMCKVGG